MAGAADTPNGPTVRMPDGSVVPLAEATFNIEYSVKTSLDGQVADLGLAYRMLLTYRTWASQELDRLRTEVADMKAHLDYCSVAKAEAEKQ